MPIILYDWMKYFIPYYGLFFYVIYRYVFSKWRLIRPVEINQYDITMATHYDITMGNDVARDIHCDVTVRNDIAMCTYHCITMHNDIAMNLLYYIFSSLCLNVLFYYGYHEIKTKTSSWLISLGWRTHSLFLCRTVSLIL